MSQLAEYLLTKGDVIVRLNIPDLTPQQASQVVSLIATFGKGCEYATSAAILPKPDPKEFDWEAYVSSLKRAVAAVAVTALGDMTPRQN